MQNNISNKIQTYGEVYIHVTWCTFICGFPSQYPFYFCHFSLIFKINQVLRAIRRTDRAWTSMLKNNMGQRKGGEAPAAGKSKPSNSKEHRHQEKSLFKNNTKRERVCWMLPRKPGQRYMSPCEDQYSHTIQLKRGGWQFQSCKSFPWANKSTPMNNKHKLDPGHLQFNSLLCHVEKD